MSAAVNPYLSITSANFSKKTLTFYALNDVALPRLVGRTHFRMDSSGFRFKNIVSHSFPAILFAVQLGGILMPNLAAHS